MFKKLGIGLIAIFFGGCCTSTNTYDSFTDEQLKLLHYLSGQNITYDVGNTDSIIYLHVSERFIGNLPPDELEESNCDSYYPAYGKATIIANTDTSIKFQISIKKSNDIDGVSERIKWMGYDFNLNDTTRVQFHDSLFFRLPSQFNNVYEIKLEDTTNTRSDLIYRIFFSTEYGIIRFDRKDGMIYRLRF
jgi:hypothetical protein